MQITKLLYCQDVKCMIKIKKLWNCHNAGASWTSTLTIEVENECPGHIPIVIFKGNSIISAVVLKGLNLNQPTNWHVVGGVDANSGHICSSTGSYVWHAMLKNPPSKGPVSVFLFHLIPFFVWIYMYSYILLQTCGWCLAHSSCKGCLTTGKCFLHRWRWPELWL